MDMVVVSMSEVGGMVGGRRRVRSDRVMSCDEHEKMI